jgi:hypothetical protein
MNQVCNYGPGRPPGVVLTSLDPRGIGLVSLDPLGKFPPRPMTGYRPRLAQPLRRGLQLAQRLGQKTCPTRPLGCGPCLTRRPGGAPSRPTPLGKDSLSLDDRRRTSRREETACIPAWGPYRPPTDPGVGLVPRAAP